MTAGARIGIIGGGIAGLSSAYQLAKSGYSVTLFELSNELGGLGTFANIEGKNIDCFYHCIMPSDRFLLDLIGELGLSEKLYWRNTTMGMIYDSRHFEFNTPFDLLRFTPLTFFQRLRLGAVGLLLPHLSNDESLDSKPIADWLKPLFGVDLWHKFWEPMFAAKFGDGVGNLPSLYLSRRLGRESNVATRGYLTGGLFGLIQALRNAICDNYGEVRTQCPVAGLSSDDNQTTITLASGETLTFDAVLSTLPFALLKKIIEDDRQTASLPDLEYQGVINVLFLLNRPLRSHYWTPVINSATPFYGVVESSALVDPEHYGAEAAVYVMKYTTRDSTAFAEHVDAIQRDWTAAFLRLYEEIGVSRRNIRKCLVFKAPFVEPIYPLGYNNFKPDIRIADSTLFLATTAQVYPNITSWNSSIEVANRAVQQIQAKFNS